MGLGRRMRFKIPSPGVTTLETPSTSVTEDLSPKPDEVYWCLDYEVRTSRQQERDTGMKWWRQKGLRRGMTEEHARKLFEGFESDESLRKPRLVRVQEYVVEEGPR